MVGPGELLAPRIASLLGQLASVPTQFAAECNELSAALPNRRLLHFEEVVDCVLRLAHFIADGLGTDEKIVSETFGLLLGFEIGHHTTPFEVVVNDLSFSESAATIAKSPSERRRRF
jgi:hypothetical protein